VCAETREMCHKLGRDLLVSIAITHPFIISLIIQKTNHNMVNIGGVSCKTHSILSNCLMKPYKGTLK
jgi:hypothetical protein